MAEDNAQVVMAVENYANIFVPNPAVIINEFYKIIKDGKLKKGYLLNIPFLISIQMNLFCYAFQPFYHEQHDSH